MKLKVPLVKDMSNLGKSIVGAHSIEELCSLLKRPRRVMLLVKAGPAVDDFIEALLPHLEKGMSSNFAAHIRRHHHRWRKLAFPRFQPSMQIPR
jgi:6-phosphogluconate dehydrogenase